jgi:hypothetical protein
MKSSVKLFLAACVASLAALTTHAVPVTLGSNTYDVIAYTPHDSSQNIVDLLNDQPWWNDTGLAASAAGQVNSQLGSFYPDIPEFGWGPFFATSTSSGRFWQGDQNQVSSVGFSDTYDGFTFAVVNTNASVPDGGMTALLVGGALLGAGALRRRFARA